MGKEGDKLKEEAKKISFELSKSDCLILSECLSIAVSTLGTKDPNGTIAILNVDQKIKEKFK